MEGPQEDGGSVNHGYSKQEDGGGGIETGGVNVAGQEECR
jgi:hypothetical protein